jgi:osmoprotectant transport system ATP-binding protein
VDATPAVSFEAVTKRYPDGTVAVAEFTLQVAEGEVVVLVGPSGCGKTTTLRMVNRLIEPTSGRVLVQGSDVARMDPVRLRRGIGYVIQQVGLFPHRTVLANVATVPRLLGWDNRRARGRAEELLDLVGLDPAVHGHRFPHQLSGGQQQRVGVARALAADPPVLLMDEPFGAVDPIARDRLQLEFRRLQQDVRKTVLFVTHDIVEAVRLGDRIAVLSEGGHVEQYGPPVSVLGEPATEFVADFVGRDRMLTQLSAMHVTDAVLDSVDDARFDGKAGVRAAGHGVRDAVDGGPTVRPDDTLADALSVILASRTGWATVDDGQRHRRLSLEAVHAAVQATTGERPSSGEAEGGEPTEPTAAAGAAGADGG